ncbi:FAD-dependent oxidoreductase [Gordonia sp. zg691]|uniref:flavin monoamine oxidase family protein n=1 Tax=Gordonia jinghuaiqii TaxID=2758710 RepID=UPI0016628370|nr:FAD-dependent oxidoreductase [Gordonia jinghuaiqii]MBD0863095.1 FAD-dependent oxidoreductase [Gordonia jinghuaiqii]
MNAAPRRVVVVGAGIAGLTAARELVSAGVEVTVVEARDRVGGRIVGVPILDDAVADGGAAYLGDRHTELLALVHEFGLSLVSTEMIGDSAFLISAERTTTGRRVPPFNPIALGGLFDCLEEVIDGVDPGAPWESADAERLDNLTADRWLAGLRLHPDAEEFFPIFLGEMMGADPHSISVLHMAVYLRSGGGLRYLNAFEGGAQRWRIAGGSQRLCEAIALRLGPRVVVNAPVVAVVQDADEVVVHSVSVVDGADSTFRADRVIIAVPPRLAQRMEFRPGLCEPRATEATAPGCVIKVHLGYPAPLWRRRGLSGWSASTDGLVQFTVDDSPADESVGVLTGFVTGDAARTFSSLSTTEQRSAVLTHIGRLFPELPEPAGFSVTDWPAEEYSEGCYAALFGPGDWHQLGPHLTTPHGLVHWAGTETSLEFFGLMEGAIRSGKRAAAELTLDMEGALR